MTGNTINNYNNTYNNTNYVMQFISYNNADSMNKIAPKFKLTKEEFRKYTDTWKYPIVDMIVRTGWDKRHSWFMLFDSEYAEYYFSEKLWPDYNEEELNKTLDSFKKSKRNFWK